MVVSRVATLGLGFLSVCALLVSSGCDPGLGSPVKVSGTVTVDDKPLANAAITLNCTEERPIEHKAFNATTASDGSYEIAAVYPGPYEVIVGESGEGMDDPGMAGAAAPDELQPVAEVRRIGDESFAGRTESWNRFTGAVSIGLLSTSESESLRA
ncbi:MAG: hypothetical protein CMJ64_02255 [Planctomycetaceae bacterium]|nr:hypothetical protein [Planctomycetaceae bacterium]